MSKNALKILVLNLGILIFASLVFGFMLLEINRSGERLISYLETSQEREAKRGSALIVERLIEETAATREQIDSAFFNTEGDAIQFLTETERVARAQGLELKTDSLEAKADAENPGASQVEIKFSLSGTESLVRAFINYLETLPFHSTVTDLSLTANDQTGAWSAQLTIVLTVIEKK